MSTTPRTLETWGDYLRDIASDCGLGVNGVSTWSLAGDVEVHVSAEFINTPDSPHAALGETLVIDVLIEADPSTQTFGVVVTHYGTNEKREEATAPQHLKAWTSGINEAQNIFNAIVARNVHANAQDSLEYYAAFDSNRCTHSHRQRFCEEVADTLGAHEMRIEDQWEEIWLDFGNFSLVLDAEDEDVLYKSCVAVIDDVTTEDIETGRLQFTDPEHARNISKAILQASEKLALFDRSFQPNHLNHRKRDNF